MVPSANASDGCVVAVVQACPGEPPDVWVQLLHYLNADTACGEAELAGALMTLGLADPY
jgi:hypothetical protein